MANNIANMYDLLVAEQAAGAQRKTIIDILIDAARPTTDVEYSPLKVEVPAGVDINNTEDINSIVVLQGYDDGGNVWFQIENGEDISYRNSLGQIISSAPYGFRLGLVPTGPTLSIELSSGNHSFENSQKLNKVISTGLSQNFQYSTRRGGIGVGVVGPNDFEIEQGDYFSSISSQTSLILKGYGSAQQFSLLKVLLQGAWRGTEMGTELLNGSYLPLLDPEGGVVSVSNFPINTVDWLNVFIYSIINVGEVANIPAFLLKDGSVVSIDGNPFSVTSDNCESLIDGNQYYIRISHRNHLPVTTPNLKTIVFGEAIIHDFTLSQSSAYQNPSVTQNAAMKQLSSGQFAMWGGDANRNGSARASGGSSVNDLTYIKGWPNGTGYYRADTNRDGIVSTSAPEVPGGDDYFLIHEVLGGNTAAVIFQHILS